ncbi:Bifunctional inhibitor/plant lipid transfer protein/seed storage helical domain [Dillenia turbinata]|uniref:Bifunctional inhibitor/plant lipid transfer protein/seed storage helical domain n=1 Tax=Dillenia turbinata TaxID=194707 RepID=A0AAN8VW43_9MAGN
MGNGEMWVLVAIIGLVTIGVTEGQTEPSCANDLEPCLAYLNSTSPPASCCDPLKKTVETQRACLCSLYENPSLLKALGVNLTQALELPKYCGVSDNVSACNSSALSPTSTPPPPPPPTAGNAARNLAWMGLSGLLLFCASLMNF